MPVNGDPALQDAALLQELHNALTVGGATRIGIAVSGGSDSMALLHLMAARGGDLRAVTVDHDLRVEAAAEAGMVAGVCAGLGIAHSVLRWKHGEIAGNLQDQARQARYGLMADWALREGVSHIVLGHTADDQAETFLMGLARGAGLDGLVGMRARWDQGDVVFVRPLLARSRADLRRFLVRRGVAWVDDPSNADARFMRVKARQVLAELGPLGIDSGVIGSVIGNLRRAQVALGDVVAAVAAKVARQDAGSLIFAREAFLHEGPEVRRRLLIAALRWVSAAEYAPRAQAVARLLEAVEAECDGVLWGCRIRCAGADVRIVREPQSVAGVICATDQLWDGRWQMDGPHTSGLEVRALGVAGLRGCKGWRDVGHGRDALIVSPGVWAGETLVAAPVAGLANGWEARIVAPFDLFAVSH